MPPSIDSVEQGGWSKASAVDVNGVTACADEAWLGKSADGTPGTREAAARTAVSR